jgi:hypothetical protein
MGSAGHVAHSGAYGARSIDALFFMLGWDLYRFDKKRAGTCYTELVFFHPVESMGQVVHSGEFETPNIDALFFMLGWARCSVHEKRTRRRYAELVFL